MKKVRLTALDGLRGLAALSVAISHSGFDIRVLTTFPPIVWAFRTLAVGPNSVQVFFVLSGFLMAYLYPSIKNKINFILKRYARIFPIFVVIVLFIGIANLFLNNLIWYKQLAFLLSLALATRFIWKISRIFDKSQKSKYFLFFFFLFIQIVSLLFNLFITPQLVDYHNFLIPKFYENLIIIVSNFTLTTPFVRDVVRLSIVFWSLAPEIVFYIIYPFLVIPLINIGSKRGWKTGIFVILGILIILFKLDEVMRGLFSMFTFNIARSGGFVVGVTIGTIYRNQNGIWKKFENIFSKNWFGVLAISALVLAQVGDWSIRDGQTIWFMNLYYLISSFAVGLAVIASIVPGSFVQRFFSNRVLVFLGMISYSLYLSHSHVQPWGHVIAEPLRTIISSRQVFAIVEFTIIMSLCIGVAYALYMLVESLYFESKKSNNLALTKITLERENSSVGYKKYNRVFVVFIFSIIYIWIYTGGFSPTLFSAHHSINKFGFFDHPRSLLKSKLTFPVTAKYDNFSVVTLSLWYFKNADVTRSENPKSATLYFRLYEEGNSKPIFQADRYAYEIEGEPNYPFGFPTISNSKGKKYLVELELVGGSTNDMIYVNTTPDRVTTTYTNSKNEIINRPDKLIWNRISYTLSHPDTIFLLGFLGVLVLIKKEILIIRNS